MSASDQLHVAVIGSGAAGLSAAWLLSQQHKITLLEKDARLGGHANTAATTDHDAQWIDTGFIVYNEPSYPNLTNWFECIGVTTVPSEMSFAVSRDNGNFEYAGGPMFGLLAQPSVVLQRRFWRMLIDLLRFYCNAPNQIPDDTALTLGEYLRQGGYSCEFLDDHLMPFAAAIWSNTADTLLDYPAAAFIRFCDNHGLLRISNRPQWRTVSGGSRSYVNAVRNSLAEHAIREGFDAISVSRHANRVEIVSATGEMVSADHVVFATHADQALGMLEQPSALETELLGVFGYEPNLAYLHTDISYLPKRRKAWCSWNYVESQARDDKVGVSYWMNRLQNLQSQTNYIVTLNPAIAPAAEHTLNMEQYSHPVFNPQTYAAQQQLWSLQGQQRSWFCGSYFGAGFHEDAVQSGFAVAEHLGSVQRPWVLENPSSRIVVSGAAGHNTVENPAMAL